MKFCPQCGKTFDAELRFCLECGFDKETVKSTDSGSPLQREVPLQEKTATPPKVSGFPVSDPGPHRECPQCGSVVKRAERFCPQCAFDTSVQKPVDPYASKPVDQPEPIAPLAQGQAAGKTMNPTAQTAKQQGIPAPPPVPERASSPNNPYSSGASQPRAEPEGQKNRFSLLAIVIVAVFLGTASWLVYNYYFKPTSQSPANTQGNTVTSEMPLSGAEPAAANATEADETEAPAQSAPENANATPKPLSRIDQELARQKAASQNKPAQQTNAASHEGKPATGVKISGANTPENDKRTEVILEVGHKEDAKSKKPKDPTKLSISAPTMIIRITTDHYNGGMGTQKAGTISLKDSKGNILGSFRANGKSGKDGTPNAKWVVEPRKVLEKGTYYIWDSDMPTWSKNLFGNGFVVVEGYEVE